jgi:hypothetical protein
LQLGCGVLAISALSGAVALAVQPTKGAVYMSFGEDNVSFEVSANGKSLSHLSTGSVAACGGLAPGTLKWPSHVAISHGRFSTAAIFRAHSKDSVALNGHFTPNGGAGGTFKVATECLLPPNFNSGPVKHEMVSWSASSEPEGPASRYCEVLELKTEFEDITLEHTTCATVDAAIKAGTTATVAPHEFTTPGWTCTRSTSAGFRFTCSRPGATFSFTNL